MTTTPAPGACENGEYYAVQGNCEEFSRCDQGILRYIRCSAGLHWNAELGACDWPQSANCQDTASTTEATTATPATQPVTTTQTTITTTSMTTTMTTTTTRPAATTAATTSTTEWAPTQQLPDSCENGQYFQRGPDCSEYQICVNIPGAEVRRNSTLEHADKNLRLAGHRWLSFRLQYETRRLFGQRRVPQTPD